MEIKLKTGKMDVNPNMDGWIITSATATFCPPNDDIILTEGDHIDINGNVTHNNRFIANVR